MRRSKGSLSMNRLVPVENLSHGVCGGYYDKTKELQKNTDRLLSWVCNTGYIGKLYAAVVFNIQEYIWNYP